MQGHGFDPWSGKMLQCCEATKPEGHSYWVCALEPGGHNCWAHKLQPLKAACSRTCALQQEKPPQWKTATRESPRVATTDPAQPRINKLINKITLKRVPSCLSFPWLLLQIFINSMALNHRQLFSLGSGGRRSEGKVPHPSCLFQLLVEATSLAFLGLWPHHSISASASHGLLLCLCASSFISLKGLSGRIQGHPDPPWSHLDPYLNHISKDPISQ